MGVINLQATLRPAIRKHRCCVFADRLRDPRSKRGQWRGVASGWLPGRLSERGRALARELGERRVADGLAAVFTSDLRRALETVELAFADSGPPVLVDWRLRECDCGAFNGAAAAHVHAKRRRHLSMPYPDGESWEQAIRRVGRFLGDLPLRWHGQRALVIGHLATRWAFDHLSTACVSKT